MLSKGVALSVPILAATVQARQSIQPLRGYGGVGGGIIRRHEWSRLER